MVAQLAAAEVRASVAPLADDSPLGDSAQGDSLQADYSVVLQGDDSVPDDSPRAG